MVRTASGRAPGSRLRVFQLRLEPVVHRAAAFPKFKTRTVTVAEEPLEGSLTIEWGFERTERKKVEFTTTLSSYSTRLDPIFSVKLVRVCGGCLGAERR